MSIRMTQQEVYETLSLTGSALSEFMASPNGLERYQAAEQLRKRVAEVDGRHYTDHTKDVKSLIKEKRLIEAEVLLCRLVEAVCREIEFGGQKWYPPPWYHEKLASVQRRLGKSIDSVETIKRYEALLDRHNSLNHR